jgi:hypothetical protein
VLRPRPRLPPVTIAILVFEMLVFSVVVLRSLRWLRRHEG